jgi:hypothetical protein
MKLRCVVCQHQQEAEHLAVRCEGCGAAKSMQMVATFDGLKPGEPICGPSKVPHSRGVESQLRGPLEEPLHVTRERAQVYRVSIGGGMTRENARAYAIRQVPIQCGRCGGDDPRCNVCLGVATVPTDRLREERAPKQKRRPRKTRTPQGRVARVSEP